MAEIWGCPNTPKSYPKNSLMKILKSPHTHTGLTRALAHYDGWRLPSPYELHQLLRSPLFRKQEGLFWSSRVRHDGYVTQLGKRSCECIAHPDITGRVVLVKR